MHTGTAGLAALGRCAQSLLGFTVCKRRGCLCAWRGPSARSSDRVGPSSLLTMINGSNYGENKANTQCALTWVVWQVSSRPHNPFRASQPPLLSSTCLWASLKTSRSLSFLIHKMGSVAPSHRTVAGPGGGGLAPANASTVLCVRQGAPRNLPLSAWRPQPLRSAGLGSIRHQSDPLGQTRR